ncbi:RNA polymerase sigma factor [Streptomyces antibioticus]|uniref:RNA polymerase sigma factor n=1 Tax=Streptomyces antibioticus TaxID=1890 RepID=UPI0022532C8B|nr:RNA polymerase sigma factor [Streptomyces antibioticus]MCX4739516.1 RNA polymerase sigma factor [Streptomyces antibioticus]
MEGATAGILHEARGIPSVVRSPEDHDPEAHREHVLREAYGKSNFLIITRLRRAGLMDQAEDIAHEAWVRAWRDERFDAGRDPLPYVWTIARNLATDLLRRRGREVPLEVLGDVVAAEDDDMTVWCEEIDPAIAAVRSPQGRQVLMMQRGGREDDEIASHLGVSKNQVSVQRHRALREVRRHVRRGEGSGGE